jgi:tetratricopeptide (TPR) repeat protein
MDRIHPTLDGRARRCGRRSRAWGALGALALAMVLGLGGSPAAALPSTPAAGSGGPSGVFPVNGGISAGDLDAAERLTALGERYIEQHALVEAEAAFRGALAIVEAALGPTDPRLADSMTALADVRSERRDFSGAETLYRRALAVVETAYGSEDPRVAGPLANLAGLYRTWERWDDAASVYLRLAGVFGRVLGPDDFHLAMTLEHVAEAYAAQGRYADAEKLYGGVLAILVPRLGSEHPLVQKVLAEHARARRQLELNDAKKG